jgi:hypothetical protein
MSRTDRLLICLALGYLAARFLHEHVKAVAPLCKFEVLHIVPRGDCIEHVCGGEECICGPTVRPVRRDGGGWQWVARHHALWVAAADESR